MATRKSKGKPDLTKGVSSMGGMQPGANLAPVTTNLPDQAISIAANLNQYNALQPADCFAMSVSCRKAVQAIVNEASRAAVRVFTRDGDEVIDGELVRLLKRPAANWTTKRFLSDIMSWHLLAGEVAVSVMTDGKTGLPDSMLPLAPNRLYPIDPTTPNELSDIHLWQYTWQNGMIGQIPNAGAPAVAFPGAYVQLKPQSVIFVPAFNPFSHVRGLSPFVTGVNAASVNYQALRYMKDYYTNDAIPSHLLVLPPGLSEKQRKDFEQRYLEQYGTANAQAHKVMVVTGNGVKVEKLENDLKTEQQLLLLQYTDDQIAQLFSIPPTVMGNWNKARFETAAIERTQFLESTVLPMTETIADILQNQLVDRFFPYANVVRGKGLKLSKSLKGLLDKKLDDFSGQYLIVLDLSAIPLMTQVNIDRFNAVEALCLKGRMSVNEAAEYIGLELPANPLRDRIYIPSGLVEVTDARVVPVPAPVIPQQDQAEDELEGDIQHSNDRQRRTMAEVQQADKLAPAVKSLHQAYRLVRKQFLRDAAAGRLSSLATLDKLCESAIAAVPSLRKQLRKDRFLIKKLVQEADDKSAAVRAFFNAKKPSVLRELAATTVEAA